jgi:hypothetical protein
LADKGFVVHTYAETVDWRHRLTAIGDALVERAAEIAAETDADAAVVRARTEEMRRTIDDMIRRVFIVAERV